MPILVNIDGRLVPPEEATVSVFDRGFLFGDSVYETIRTYRGRPFLLDRHLARLARSAESLSLPVPRGMDALRHEVVRTLDAAANDESYLRVVVTRGSKDGFVNLDAQTAEDGTVVLIVRPFEGYDPSCHADGVDVALVGVHRTGRRSLDPKIKSGNYLNNILALREAKRLGCFECLMPNRDGDITEGSTSNVFLVKGGRLVTPALESGLLDGITRGYVLELAAEAGVEVVEERVGVDELGRADGLFLTSSLKEIMPIRCVKGADGDVLWAGRPHPIATDLLERYRARALAEVGVVE